MTASDRELSELRPLHTEHISFRDVYEHLPRKQRLQVADMTDEQLQELYDKTHGAIRRSLGKSFSTFRDMICQLAANEIKLPEDAQD